MTKEETRQVENAIDYLNRAWAFLMQDDVIVARLNCKAAAMPESDFTSKTGVRATTICKDIGSPLAMFSGANRTLRILVENRGHKPARATQPHKALCAALDR